MNAPHPPTSRTRSRASMGIVVAVAIVGAAIAAGLRYGVVSPDSKAREEATPRPAIAKAKPVAKPAPAAEAKVPLYSEPWTDDAGNGLAQRYHLPVRDPFSLAEVRTSNEGRAARGIADFRRAFDAVDRRTLAGRVKAMELSVFIGQLHSSAGEFVEADQWFATALAVVPECPPLLQANIEALRGVTALRRGETENCVACCTKASCIFPLAPEAIHQSPSGSREAIERFTNYLQKRPEDLGVRWLLNVAHMTLGTYPDAVPKAHLIPLEPFLSQGDIGRFPNVSAQVGLAARGENMSGGIVVDDFDGDGMPDVFYSTLDPSQGCALFVNQGDGTFADRSSEAGLEDQVGALNCIHADYDNDGDLDILLLRGGWEGPMRPSLLQNDGRGHFADVTIAAGVARPIASQAAGWADFDGDGDVDLFIGGEYHANTPDPRNRGYLYRNNGDGTFTDVAIAAGLRNEHACKGVAWGDYDNDGRPDLYLANNEGPNRLFHNNGNGTFTDKAADLGVTEPFGCFSCWFWDYDNDGDLDLYVTGSRATLVQVIQSHLGEPSLGERPRLYRNDGGTFRDVAKESGLDRVWLPMGSNFGDIDNDGFLDFYLGTGSPPYSFIMPNILMHNVGGKRFEDVTVSSGTGHLQKGHGIAFADWDQDGDNDLFLQAGGATPGDKAHNALFENPGHGNAWVGVKLVGTMANRAAIGARMRVEAEGPDGPVVIHRVIGGGSSFGNNPLATTIGLGRARTITAIEVTWPGSGTHQVTRGIPIDGAIEITEGREGFRSLERKVLVGLVPKS